MTSRSWIAIGLLLLASRVPVQPAERASCAVSIEERQPLFGELHIHTGFSQDALVAGVRTTPADAYRFARGEAILLPGPLSNPHQTRVRRLARPLDFAAVTDHAEYLGPVLICLDPSAVGHGEKPCRAARSEWNPWWIPTAIFKRLAVLRSDDWTSYLRAVPAPSPLCNHAGVRCDEAAATAWQKIQQAADDAYDQTAGCSFTTFVAYEFSAAPENSNLHRNVIFRNAEVPDRAYSAIDAGNDPAGLWRHLRTECLDNERGCDVLTIPHNSNLSLGRMFEDPPSRAYAEQRRDLEPLVEIYQHKGNSECLAGESGVGSADELCDFERIAMTSLKVGLFGGDAVPRRAFVREALKQGLRLQGSLGFNPFRYGIVGGTDNHNGTAGDTEEGSWEGAFGAIDANLSDWPANRISGPYATFSPGGLSVVWAQENSRDSIFRALRRRETYATSGTRPIVRFFAGWELQSGMCESTSFAALGYADGVPMGGTLPPPPDDRAPRFAISALKDAGDARRRGTDLQRIQIVKGWLDAKGELHEAIYTVAGTADLGATIDHDSLQPVGKGASALCTVWEDSDFDPEAPAFYYVRVLENPTPRWSTLQCRKTGVDVFAESATCLAQVRATQGRLAEYLTYCCADEDGRHEIPPIIQERAWTSPIWFTP